MSLRDNILAARHGEDSMQWPGTDQDIVVRGLSGLERARLIDRLAASPDADAMGKNERLQLQFACTIVLGCYLPDGSRLFQDDDVLALAAGEDIEVLAPVANRIMELSRIGEDQEIAEAKNS